MRYFLTTLTMVLALLVTTAQAEEIVAGLNQNQISITTDFDGSELFVYGAVKRTAPAPEGPLDVIVVVIGPSKPVIVRKKERRFGIWINDAGVQVDAAPSLYAVSTNRPFREVISFTQDQLYKVGLNHSVKLIGNTNDAAYPEDYLRAAIRLNEARGLYFEQPQGVTINQETLFQTRIRLPAQLVEGDYRVRVFLLRDRTVVDTLEQGIDVRKVGLERWIYTMAKENAAIYGLLSIALALAAGWLASTFFRLVFP
ncbi:MAG: TIGR02186 family protein [Pseudomonadota bacterium]